MGSRHAGVRWMERKGIVAALGVVTFVAGAGVGAAASDDADAQLVVAQLTGEVAELQDVVDESRPHEEFEQLEQRIDTLEGELGEASSAAEHAEARWADQSEELDARAAELDDRERDLDSREADLDERERAVANASTGSTGSGGSGGGSSQAASQQEAQSDPEPAGGCQAGQVDINSAGLQELQRIHEIGPARAEQIVALRPFRSVDDLVRVSGIAEARLGAIKHQGVACVG